MEKQSAGFHLSVFKTDGSPYDPEVDGRFVHPRTAAVAPRGLHRRWCAFVSGLGGSVTVSVPSGRPLGLFRQIAADLCINLDLFVPRGFVLFFFGTLAAAGAAWIYREAGLIPILASVFAAVFCAAFARMLSRIRE